MCYQFPDSNVTVWIDMFEKKKEPIVWMCVILPYSTVGIWGVEVVLPDYAANW